MKELLLKLSTFEFIKIIPDYDRDFKEIDYCCNLIKVYFLYSNKTLRIGQDSAGELFEHILGLLKKSINNNLQLHESITKNLGFMENQYYHILPHEKNEFFMVQTQTEKTSYWIGSRYEMWTTYADANPHVNTWLYNNSKADIIFEVTKFYKWSTQEYDPEDLEDPEYITYDEFMKDYKPLIQRVIPRDVAIEWVEQLMKVYKGLFEKEEDFIRRCKEMGW